MTDKKYRWPELEREWITKKAYAPHSAFLVLQLLGLEEGFDLNQAEDLIDEMREALEEKRERATPHEPGPACASCYELGRQDERLFGDKRMGIEARWLAMIRMYLGDAPPRPIRTGVGLQKLLEEEDAKDDALAHLLDAELEQKKVRAKAILHGANQGGKTGPMEIEDIEIAQGLLPPRQDDLYMVTSPDRIVIVDADGGLMAMRLREGPVSFFPPFPPELWARVKGELRVRDNRDWADKAKLRGLIRQQFNPSPVDRLLHERQVAERLFEAAQAGLIGPSPPLNLAGREEIRKGWEDVRVFASANFPHACPSCGSPAYVGATQVECSSAECQHGKKT